jgi:hypothetical protein
MPLLLPFCVATVDAIVKGSMGNAAMKSVNIRSICRSVKACDYRAPRGGAKAGAKGKFAADFY